MKSKTISAKRILSVLMAALMLAALVPAATSVTASEISMAVAFATGDELNVIGMIDDVTEQEHMLVFMTNPGVEPRYEIEDDGDDSNDILALGYVNFTPEIADGASGRLAFTMNAYIPDSVPTGTYLISLGTSDGDIVYEMDMDYVGAADRAAAMEVYYDEDTTADELIAALERVPGTIRAAGAPEVYYEALGEEGKQKYAELVLSYRDRVEEGDETIETFGELSQEAIIVAAVLTASTDSQYENAFDAIQGYASVVGLDTEDERFVMITQAENFIRTLVAQNPEMTSAEDIEAVLDTALYLARLNETSTLAYAGYIEENNSFFGVPEDELEAVTDNSRILTYFSQAMRAGLPVYSLEDFSELWSEAYQQAEEDYEDYLDDQGGGGSGGGSGGSSGGSSGGNRNNTTSVSVNPNIMGSDPLGKRMLATDYYDDVEGYEWAHDAILSLTESGIISGTGNNKFEPARALKREEFMKILVNTFNLADMTATSSFSDVTDTDAWYYMYIASAEKAGITSGRGDGTFGLGDEVTREEMATLVYRAAVAAGARLTTFAQSTTSYSDIDALSDYAVEAVTVLTDNGVMSGSDGKFSPQESASRAQAAVVIDNIRDYI